MILGSGWYLWLVLVVIMATARTSFFYGVPIVLKEKVAAFWNNCPGP